MSQNTAPPFPRGQTLFNKPASNTDLTTNDGTTVEGQIWEFEDISPAGVRRSNKRVKCMAVRWTGTGGVLVPKKLVVLDTNLGANGGTSVAGAIGTARAAELARVGLGAAVRCFPADEYLPSSGVAANDIFWMVLEGPAIVQAGLTQLQADVAAGDAVIAMTAGASAATSSGTTTGGRINRINTAVSTHVHGDVEAIIGTALSACTSQGTGGVDVLINVGRWQ